MRAVVVDRWLEPRELQVKDIPEPEVAPQTLQIEVRAAGCNFFDILMVQGRYQVKPPFPFVPGAEVAGIVRDAYEEWMIQMARNVTMADVGFLSPEQYLSHDRDGKYCPAFVETIEAVGIKTVKLPPRSPNFNPVAALAADPAVLDRSGEALVAAQLALDYGFRDIDGAQPEPLSL